LLPLDRSYGDEVRFLRIGLRHQAPHQPWVADVSLDESVVVECGAAGEVLQVSRTGQLVQVGHLVLGVAFQKKPNEV
jgi:hypothetical protein